MNERTGKGSLSILQDLRKEGDVVGGWDVRGVEMPDYLRSVWRGWTDEADGKGCGCCVGEDNWKSEMGEVKMVARLSVYMNFLLLFLSVVLFVTK